MDHLRADSHLPAGERTMCAERHCDRPALLAAHLARGSLRFCCVEHLHQAAELKRRELSRLDALLNKIFLLEGKWLQVYYTWDAAYIPPNTTVLYRQYINGPLAELQDTMRRAISERAYCFNGCVHALEILAGVLAYFAEESFSVEAIDIMEVKSDSSVVSIESEWIVRQNGLWANQSQVRRVCDRHTMFKLSSPLIRDAYLDPTAPQYGRPQGAQECEYYHRVYSDERPEHRLKPRDFGAEFQMMQWLKSSSNEGSYAWHRHTERQAAVRTIHNAVYKNVKPAGGPRMLREASDADSKETERNILASVDWRLRVLRDEIDWILFRADPKDRRYHYYGLPDRAHGEGNVVMVNALRRMSSMKIQL